MTVVVVASVAGWVRLLSRHSGPAGMGLVGAIVDGGQHATAAAGRDSPRSPL
jgi:hypothetical protein